MLLSYYKWAEITSCHWGLLSDLCVLAQPPVRTLVGAAACCSFFSIQVLVGRSFILGLIDEKILVKILAQNMPPCQLFLVLISVIQACVSGTAVQCLAPWIVDSSVSLGITFLIILFFNFSIINFWGNRSWRNQYQEKQEKKCRWLRFYWLISR